MSNVVVNFYIFNLRWKIYLMSNEDYEKSVDELDKDSDGITFPTQRTILISASGFNHATIVHELVHAYTEECGIATASLTTEQMEEFYCEFTAKHAIEVHRIAKKIMKAFQSSFPVFLKNIKQRKSS